MTRIAEFTVRQVHRGFWTYDIQFLVDDFRVEWSIGECHSRRDAEKQARAAVRKIESEYKVHQ